jgi:hypothetical protein
MHSYNQDPYEQERLRNYVDKELPQLRLALRKQAAVDHVVENAVVSSRQDVLSIGLRSLLASQLRAVFTVIGERYLQSFESGVYSVFEACATRVDSSIRINKSSA